MSRQTRAGAATSVVGARATPAERSEWLRCAKGAGQSLSDWLRSLANNEARETAVRTEIRRTRGNSMENTARSGRNPRR